jgi:alpha-tubulin suppressor-like RCC1 family protein
MVSDAIAQTSGQFDGGSVKIGYDNRSCTFGLSGAMRYNSSAGSAGIEFCDGSRWTNPSAYGCTAPSSCPNVGDVCDDSNAGTTNDPIFAGFTMRGTDCYQLFVTDDNQSLSTQWKTSTGSEDISPESYEDGNANQMQVVPPADGTFPAFDLCYNLTDGGFTDWYLPARAELLVLFRNQTAINVNAVSAFTTSDYWSSNERSTTESWSVDFDPGDVMNFSKTTSTYDVRCVRSVKSEGNGSSNGYVPSNVASVSTGATHDCIIKTDSSLWCWGENDQGGLGTGDTADSGVIVETSAGGTGWAKVSAGELMTCAIKTDGTLWCWGDNSNGSLGVGDTTDRLNPTQVGTDTNWADISSAEYDHIDTEDFTCATKTNGTAWCWGENTRGQLGDGTTTQRTSPVQVGTDTDWAVIDAGGSHTCGVKTGGTLWCWGRDAKGQLGQGGAIPGTNSSSPIQVGTDTDWATVSAGGEHVCALKTDNTYWCWGEGGGGRLGTGSTADSSIVTQVGTDTDWAKISAGDAHTCGLKTGGTIWCNGINDDIGPLGLRSGTSPSVPTQEYTAATDWAEVSASKAETNNNYNHTCAVKTNGELWCWGWSIINRTPQRARLAP